MPVGAARHSHCRSTAKVPHRGRPRHFRQASSSVRHARIPPAGVPCRHAGVAARGERALQLCKYEPCVEALIQHARGGGDGGSHMGSGQLVGMWKKDFNVPGAIGKCAEQIVRPRLFIWVLCGSVSAVLQCWDGYAIDLYLIH